MVKYHIPLRAGIRLKYLHYRHSFSNLPAFTKIRYRVKILSLIPRLNLYLNRRDFILSLKLKNFWNYQTFSIKVINIHVY